MKNNSNAEIKFLVSLLWSFLLQELYRLCVPQYIYQQQVVCHTEKEARKATTQMQDNNLKFDYAMLGVSTHVRNDTYKVDVLAVVYELNFVVNNCRQVRDNVHFHSVFECTQLNEKNFLKTTHTMV